MNICVGKDDHLAPPKKNKKKQKKKKKQPTKQTKQNKLYNINLLCILNVKWHLTN